MAGVSDRSGEELTCSLTSQKANQVQARSFARAAKFVPVPALQLIPYPLGVRLADHLDEYGPGILRTCHLAQKRNAAAMGAAAGLQP